MLLFNPARHKISEMREAQLSGRDLLIQALRGFTCRASILICAWSQHQIITREYKKKSDRIDIEPATFFLLDRVYLNTVVLECRALLDRRADAFGVRTVAEALADPGAIEGLHKYLADYPQGRMCLDRNQRDLLLDYARKYCSILATPEKKAADANHPLVMKAELVRRMANKDIAHISVDDYKLSGEDLGDVVLSLIVVASAIEAAIGDGGCPSDYALVERLAFRGVAKLLGVQTSEEPHTINMVRSFLPLWIDSGMEFPHYPDEFLESRDQGDSAQGA